VYYLSTDVQPELFVDTTRGEKLRINMDITFPKLPCSYLSVDAMDIAGEHQLDVEHNLFKKRLTPDGRPLGIEKGELEPAVTPYSTSSADTAESVTEKQCGSCYGAETDLDQCCNTCAEVREAYRKKGWAFTDPNSIEQCAREGFVDNLEKQKEEGCQVYGHILVNKVAGNFHFAPGKSFQSNHMHIHDLQPFNVPVFNVSHQINRISFGHDFPGIINPLDGVEKITHHNGLTMYQYLVKIVPTIYESLDGTVINTNQFSVTEHTRNMPPGEKSGLPGVFVMYDLSPIMVKFSEKTKSFAHFLTGICAIIGGVFTVAGLIDSVLYSSMRSLGKKMELGKAF